MEEFKLKAWHKSQKRMFPVYGIGKDFITEDTLDGIDPGTNCFSGDQLEDITVLRPTGLKDLKQIEVWEGDLRRYKGKIYKVVDCEWKFILERNLVEFGENNQIDLGEDEAHESVYYGNIYEHPHFIKR